MWCYHLQIPPPEWEVAVVSLTQVSIMNPGLCTVLHDLRGDKPRQLQLGEPEVETFEFKLTEPKQCCPTLTELEKKEL